MKFLTILIALALLLCAGAGAKYSPPLEMNTNKITGLGNGTSAQDAMTVSQGAANRMLSDANTYIVTVGTNVEEHYATGALKTSCAVSNSSGVHLILEDALNRGGIIDLGAGTYNITTNRLDIPNAGQEWLLRGAGPSLTTISGTGTNIFYYPPTTTYKRTGTIQDLTIDGKTVANGIYMYAKYCWTNIVDHVRFVNCNYAVHIADSVGLNLIYPKIDSCAYGIAVYGTAANGTTTMSVIRPSIATITNQAIYLEGKVSGCYFGPTGVIELGGNQTTKLYGTAQGSPAGNVFTGLWFEEDGTNCMIFLSSATMTNEYYGPKGNVFRDNTFHCGSNVEAFYVKNGRRNIFEGNTCFGSGTTHFTIRETTTTGQNLILNCVSDNNGHWVVTDTGRSNVKTNVAETD